ncbi:MAG: DoxX family protein [Salinarimonadaceae bacterium]|nr:MAG: DoxX family protein [Salinarimonadaceae bacterium]
MQRPSPVEGDYAVAVVRVALGVMFLSHGLLKLTVFGLSGFEGFLVSRGLPTLLAWPIMLAEIAGGAMILLGLAGRAATAALTPVLVGAFAVHWPNGSPFAAAGGGWEYPAFLLAAAVAHLEGATAH